MENGIFKLKHHGAVNGVTGSCHELVIEQGSIQQGVLIDCGLFQGGEMSPGGDEQSELEINFPVQHIKALVVTHVHIDHVGRIPYLLAAGFNGPIICSKASAILLPLVLEDALKIGLTRNKRLIESFLSRISDQIIALDLNCWHAIIAGKETSLKVKLKNAGHILGSTYVEFSVSNGKNNQRVIFSGDLGPPYTPLLSAPKSPYRADCLVIESTYGDKLHENRRTRLKRLERIIVSALQDNGVILIPAFSIGRTQELLYEIESLIHKLSGHKITQHLNWQDMEIIIDSPLAARFTQAYRKLKPFWDAEARARLKAGRHPLSFAQLLTIDDHETHLRTVDYLAKTARPAIVIAASGMCTGGRVVNYLKALLTDKRNDILFVGYQARGTAGRDIQQYGPKNGYVELDGQRYDIQARVHTLGGYSAHADQSDLLRFIQRIRHKPLEIRIVHGDDEAKLALKEAIEEKFKIPAIIPQVIE